MNILDKFKKITNYNLQTYFVDYNDFLSSELNQIVAYYKGTSSVNKTAFKVLFDLYKESVKIESIISSLNSGLSNTTEFWDLIDELSKIKTSLESIINLSKWMRSSYVFGYENQSKFKYILKQNQTLESLAFDLGSDDPNEDWVSIAVSNQMKEIDYDIQGGNVLDLSKKDNQEINITTVVDVMVGDNILGKDLPTKIELTSDGLRTLDINETMEQSAEICLTTTKGSVPEFPTIGISKYFVGSTLNALRLSSLLREVMSNFKTDDSFKSVQMIDNGVEQDIAFYNFKIVSRLNNEINKTL